MGGRRTLACALALLCAVLAGCASVVGPEALLRSHAYEGPRRPPQALATVFSRFGVEDESVAFVCGVDERVYARPGLMTSCPSVVFLPPGAHELWVAYRWAGATYRTRVPVEIERGLLYEITLAKARGGPVRVSVHQLPPGAVLTYRELAPPFFAQGDRADAPVPFEPN